MLIGSHRECESLGEVVLLPMEFALNRACTCGRKIRECPLWSEVARRLHVDMENDPYGLNLGYQKIEFGDPRLKDPWLRVWIRLGYGLSYYRYLYNLKSLDRFASRFEESIQNTFNLYDVVQAITRKRVVVDSSKHHTRAAAIYRSRPESVRIILLVRDGRGVFYSGLKSGLGRSYSLEAWRRHYTHAMPLLRKCVKPEHMLFVRYENMVENPPRTLAQICELVEIPYDEAMLKFRSVTHHNVNGNHFKFGSGEEIRLDEAWKTRLSQRDVEYFETKAGRLNRLFGYQE
jgi:Sulfotransferase family